jgi:integrase
VEETSRLVELLRSSDRAAELDLPDLVDWMLATGCRIGEALALRYGTNGDGRPILDLDARTWEVNATVVRIPGAGLAVQPRPKTTAGWRVVALPDFAVRMLEDRRGERRRKRDAEIVFPPPLSGILRDPSNVSGDVCQLLDSFECEACGGTGYQFDGDGSFRTEVTGRRIRCEEGPWSWVTSHTFRKTVATRLDEGAHPPAGGRPVGPCQPVDDARCVLRAPGGQRRGGAGVGPLTYVGAAANSWHDPRAAITLAA